MATTTERSRTVLREKAGNPVWRKAPRSLLRPPVALRRLGARRIPGGGVDHRVSTVPFCLRRRAGALGDRRSDGHPLRRRHHLHGHERSIREGESRRARSPDRSQAAAVRRCDGSRPGRRSRRRGGDGVRGGRHGTGGPGAVFRSAERRPVLRDRRARPRGHRGGHRRTRGLAARLRRRRRWVPVPAIRSSFDPARPSCP